MCAQHDPERFVAFANRDKEGLHEAAREVDFYASLSVSSSNFPHQALATLPLVAVLTQVKTSVHPFLVHAPRSEACPNHIPSNMHHDNMGRRVL